MRIFVFAYGAGLIFISILAAFRPDFYGNVGFLILGAALGIYPPFLILEYQEKRNAKRIAVALFQELANRAARCCFDYEDPWKKLRTSPTNMDALRLRRFSPEQPIIYPALAPQISVFSNEIGQSIIRFYIFLAAWQKDAESTASEYSKSEFSFSFVPQDRVIQLSRRLKNTLAPAKDALEKLGTLVPDAESIELDAIAELDKLFRNRHPNAGKPLRVRIMLALNDSQ